MDKKGNLYGEQDYEDENTLFAEHADVSCSNQKKKTSLKRILKTFRN